MMFSPIYSMRRLWCLLAVVGVLLFSSHADAQLATFPGALGFGGTTAGAFVVVGGTSHSGGTVYHVTNLNDSGAGSFRTGVSKGGNIVVFDVGGSIQNLSPCVVQSNVTIEGQTAPGGIQVFGAETSMYGHQNIVCRYVRFRDGTLDPNYPGSNGTQSSTNAVNMGSTNHIIMDHCSFEFAAYNNVDAAGAVDITFQNCIFADPIREQQFNCHFETGPVTFIDNLWMNSHGRNPLGKANLQFVNNIVYNYQYAMTTGNSSGHFDWDVVNNYFVSGPSTTSAGDCFYQVDGNQTVYAVGNYLDSNRDGSLNGSSDNNAGATMVGTAWSTTTGSLPTISAQSAYYNVVSNAGPVPRDQVDNLVVADILSLGHTGFLWTTQGSTNLGNSGYGVIVGGQALPDSDGSGMPDDWKAAMGLSLTDPTISTKTSTTTPYTNLENYLNWKAQPNAFVAKNTSALPSSVVIDLSQYAQGFGTSATYAVSNISGGTATQSGTAPYLVTYVPTLNKSGTGGFVFSVSNSTTSMTSTLGVLISQSGPSQSVRWKGNGTTNTWDTTNPNWVTLTTGSAVTFGGSDPVIFDSTGSTSPSVNITTAVAPGSIAVEGTSNYVLSGTGVIGGIGGLVKDSSGTLTISNSNANTFSGGIDVNAGTLIINQYVAGTITMGDGTAIVINNNIFPNTLDVTGTVGISGPNGGGIGPITGDGTLIFGTQGGATRIDMGGDLSKFTGDLVMGTSGVSLRFNGSTGGAGADYDLGSNGSWFYPRNGGGNTFSLGSLTGGANSYLSGASDGVTMVWSIGGDNNSTTFAGVIQGGGMSITKIGTGSLTITGTNNNYSGTTNVSGGTLVVTAPQGNSNMVVNSGATLVAPTTLSGTLTLNSGGTIYIDNPASPNSTAVLTTGSGFIINPADNSNSTIYYNLSNSPTGPNDQIDVTAGTLSMQWTVNFIINMINGSLGPGNYTMISGGSLYKRYLTLTTNIPGTNRQNIYLYTGNNPASVNLSVTGYPGSLTWSGTSGATWDLNTTPDWTGATPNTFYNLDSVTFDDSSTGSTVNITGTYQPSVVYVNNNVTNYLLTGTGGFTGTTGIVKTGTAGLTINTADNPFSGPIYVNGGTLYAQSYLGSGTIYLNGGTLNVQNGTYLGNPIVVDTDSTIVSGGNGSNKSNWIINNAGATLSSTSAVTLYLNVPTGYALTIANNLDGFQGTIEMGNDGGLVRFDGDGSAQAFFDIGTGGAYLANRDGGVTVNFGALAGGPNTVLQGRQSGSGATQSTYIVGALNVDATFAGTIYTGGDLGGLNFIKVGTGNWTLSGTSSFIGNVTIQAGTLTISGSFNNGGLNFEAQSGAAVALNGGTIATESAQIDSGAVFTGYGTINGNLVNQGTANLTGGGTLTVNGNFENDGTMTVSGSSLLVVNLPTDGSGLFVNNGLLDIMDSPGTTLPSGFVNNRTILTSALVTVQQFTMSASSCSVTIQSYTGHTYQLQKSASLTPPVWQAVGTMQAGTGSAIILTDTNATSTTTYYRVGVGP